MRDREMTFPAPPDDEQLEEYIQAALDLADGKLSPEQEIAVRDRMLADDDFRRIAEPIVESVRHPVEVSQEMLDRSYERFRVRAGLTGPSPRAAHASADTPHEYPRRTPVRRVTEGVLSWVYRQPIAAAAAAVVAVALSAGAGSWMYARAFDFTVRVPGNVQSVVTLPDSTRVQLEPGSVLHYPRENGRYTNRRVRLDEGGEARFVVSPGGERFELWTTATIVMAQDARFAVRVLPDRTEIDVEEGMVWVNPLDERGKPLLKGSPLPGYAGVLPGVSVAGPTKIQVRTAGPNDPLDDGVSTGRRQTLDDSMRPVPTLVPISGGRP